MHENPREMRIFHHDASAVTAGRTDRPGQTFASPMPAAEAVGDSRHYTIDTIMPRHFLQTAAACGVLTALVQGILDEIENDTDRAIDAAMGGLPPSFPERIVSLVIEGLRRCLRLFAHATA
jgi:serine/threonine-protein kinase HipA